MNKFLTVFGAIALISSPAMAQETTTQNVISCDNIDVSKYDATDIAQIKELCTNSQKVETISPENVREWASLGKEFAEAVTETARGLGVAANELLFTPVGILIALYFFWDIIGGIIVGIPLIFFVWFLFFQFKRMMQGRIEIEYENIPVLWGAFTVKKIVSKSVPPLSSDAIAGLVALAGIGFVLTALISGVLIF